MRMTAPETSGRPASRHARLRARRASKLSVASTTTSAAATSLHSRSPDRACSTVSMRTSGLRAARVRAAERTLGSPREAVVCTICRCRFERSTASWSTRTRRPTPLAARYMAIGDPRPPSPTRSTRDAHRRSCPSTPISGSMIWRLYRRSCSSPSSRGRGAPAEAGRVAAAVVMASKSGVARRRSHCIPAKARGADPGGGLPAWSGSGRWRWMASDGRREVATAPSAVTRTPSRKKESHASQSPERRM